MAIKSGMGGSLPTKARNDEERMQEQLLMINKGLEAISEGDLSGSTKKSKKEAEKRHVEMQKNARKEDSEEVSSSNNQSVQDSEVEIKEEVSEGHGGTDQAGAVDKKDGHGEGKTASLNH